MSSSKEVRRGASVIAATVLSLLRLSRQALVDVSTNEPGLLMHIRHVSLNRRRELGEDLRSLGSVALQSSVVQNFARTVKERVLLKQTTTQLEQRQQRQAAQRSWGANLEALRVVGAAKKGSWLFAQRNRVRAAVESPCAPASSEGTAMRSRPLVMDANRGLGREDLAEGSSSSSVSSSPIPMTGAPVGAGMAYGHGTLRGRAMEADMTRAISLEVTERIVEWVRAEVGTLMHEKLDQQIAQLTGGMGGVGGARAGSPS